MVIRDEVAWAAGFFDARGSTTVGNRVRPGHLFQNISLAIKSVMRGQLDRFEAAVGLGYVYGPYKGTGGRQAWWMYRASGFEMCQAIIAMLWPWLGTAKRAQAVARLLASRSRPPAPWRIEHRLDGLRLGGRPPTKCERDDTLNAGLAQEVGFNLHEFQRRADSIRVSIWITGSDGRILAVNRAVERHLGLPLTVIRDMGLSIVHPADRGSVELVQQHMVSHQVRIVNSCRIWSAARRYDWVLTHLARVSGQRFRGYLGTAFRFDGRTVPDTNPDEVFHRLLGPRTGLRKWRE